MTGLRRLAAIAAVLAFAAACASGNKKASIPAATQSGKEIVVKTDNGEAAAQEAGGQACAKQGKRAELTGYTCAEGTCKVMRYTFDCV